MPKRNLQSNQSGVMLVWVTASIMIVTFMIAWFVTAPVLFTFMDAMEALSGCPPETITIINNSINVIVWTALIFVGLVIFWALLSSFKKEGQEVPLG